MAQVVMLNLYVQQRWQNKRRHESHIEVLSVTLRPFYVLGGDMSLGVRSMQM
jgi:hypothetical protein